MGYEVIHARARGASHVKAGTPCEDYGPREGRLEDQKEKHKASRSMASADRLTVSQGDKKWNLTGKPIKRSFTSLLRTRRAEVFLNQSADTTNPLGMGNTHFHEGGHQIDFIAGRINGRDSPYSFQRGMADAVLSDYEHAISGHMSEAGCSEGEAQKWLTREIRRAGNAANCVSDVFGGASDGMVRGPWEHDGDYFRVACGKERLASEAFAEITADYACGNTEHIAFTKRFMPRTLALYHQIIGELVS